MSGKLPEVLRLIALGYTRKQIAQKLGISVKTFDTYRLQLVRRLGIGDAAGLMRFAVGIGFMTPPE